MTSVPAEIVAPDPSQRDQEQKAGWSFWKASLVILLVMAAGDVVARGCVDFRSRLNALGSLSEAFLWRDGLLLAFIVTAVLLVVVLAREIWSFLLDVRVGTSLVGICIFAVMSGVLVPQMSRFEDPAMRVTEQNRKGEFSAFAGAEGYFFYHLSKMVNPFADVPQGELTTEMEGMLEQYGERYGREEQKNRRKEIQGSLDSQAKLPEIRTFTRRHKDLLKSFFNVSTWLQLNRAYKSGWFATLIWLLSLSVAANFFRMSFGRLLTLRRSGFAVVHLGLLVMFAGGAISKENTVRGTLKLDLNDAPERHFVAFQNYEDMRTMPFWVKLDAFGRLDWKQLNVHFYRKDGRREPLNSPNYTLWPGRKLELDFHAGADGEPEPRVVIEVLGLHEYAQVPEGVHLEEASLRGVQGEGPIAFLELPDVAAMLAGQKRGESPAQVAAYTQRAYLAPRYAEREVAFGPDWTYRLHGVFDAQLPPLTELFGNEQLVGDLGVRILSRGDVQARRTSVRVGDSVETAGYRVEVLEAYRNYQLDAVTGEIVRDERPEAEQLPERPAVLVGITPLDGGRTEERLVLQGVDGMENPADEAADYPDLRLEFEWDAWTCAGPPRYVLHWGPGLAPVLVAEDGTRTPVKLNEPLPLGIGLPVRVTEIFEDAAVKRAVDFLPIKIRDDGFNESFYASDTRGAELRVTIDPGKETERSELVRMASPTSSLLDHWSAPDGSFELQFFENTRAFPFEWRSVLSIWEPDPSGQWHIYSGATCERLQSYSRAEAQAMIADSVAFYSQQVANTRKMLRPGLPESRRRDVEYQIGAYELRLDKYTNGMDPVPIGDYDRDGRGDFIGPVQRIDLGSEREREIRVNDYLTHAGFRFFQTDADIQRPTYSGIGVVFDPGIPPVLLGMYTIILGTILAFFVRPIVDAARGRKVAS